MWYEQIIDRLKSTFESDSRFHALWLEGSIAQGESDELSDLDVWISADDEKLDECMVDVVESLKVLGDFDINYEMKVGDNPLRHTVLHYAGTPETQTIDINMQARGREVFLDPHVDRYLSIFDKSNIIKTKDFEARSIDWPIARSRALQYIALQTPNIHKNFTRGKLLEAFLYYKYVIDYMVHFARMKYCLEKEEYGFKHIYRDLPEDAILLFEKAVLARTKEDIDLALADFKDLI